MATGAYDSNKVWIYGEDDSETTFSALLNKSASSVSTQLTSAPRKVADATARDALFPSPVQGNAVFRNDLGAVETYYGLYNSSTNPGGRDTAGWYVADRQTGLIPVKPSTITAVSGTATVDDLGVVTFTNCTAVHLQGLFNSTYRNYRILWHCDYASGIPGISFRYSTSGTVSSSNYYVSGFRWKYDGTQYNYGGAALANVPFVEGDNGYNAGKSHGNIEIFDPYTSDPTYSTHQTIGTYYNQGFNSFFGGSGHDTSIRDGIYFNPSTGTFSGKLQIFGYNN